MTKKSNKNTPKTPGEAREARLSAALRANLRRRKAAKKSSRQDTNDSDSNSVETDE